ncbi:hypothetical protein [Klebsiella aerogenes EA1509E]|nr:hypothetical protein CSC18_2990 [Klebsiella aerogenes]CCG30417.1 hypothetical protein [Klebsiella aerogenes EA1509E]
MAVTLQNHSDRESGIFLALLKEWQSVLTIHIPQCLHAAGSF